MANVYLNGISLYYERHGSGHPLLLISGTGYGGWFWHRIIDDLADTYQVILPDPRGSGETDAPPGPYSLETLTADMAGLLDYLQIRGAFVAGHGLGSYVAFHLAQARPELVSKLALLASDLSKPEALPISLEAYEAWVEGETDMRPLFELGVRKATVSGFLDAQPEFAEELIRYHLSDAVTHEAYEAQAAATREVGNDGAALKALLGQVAVPTLMLLGEQDQLLPPGEFLQAVGDLDHVRLELLPGAGHILPLEAPEAMATALREFLAARRYQNVQ